VRNRKHLWLSCMLKIISLSVGSCMGNQTSLRRSSSERDSEGESHGLAPQGQGLPISLSIHYSRTSLT
jgi:hypothetical protein